MLLLTHFKARKRPSASTIATAASEQASPARDSMCKPTPCPIEEWSRSKPVEVELLVPVESEAGQNIQNPKVVHMLGIRSVLKFELLPSGRGVLLAR